MAGPTGDAGTEQPGPLDWRPPTLAVAVWAGAWAGTSGTAWVLGLAAGLAALAAGVGWWRRCWLLAACALALLVALGLGGARSWLASSGPVPDLAAQGAVVSVEARLSGGRLLTGGPGGPLWLADATLLRVQGRNQAWTTGATVRLTASGNLTTGWAAVPAGATVAAVVRLGAALPGEPVSGWARARSVPTVVQPPGAVDTAVTAVRDGLRSAVAGLPPDPSALVPALVVGDTDGMDAALQHTFRASGLTHLTAVSGANLTLMLAAILWLAGRAGITGWSRRGVALLAVVAFVLLCRAEPSVLRAAAMGLVGMAALGWGGRRQGLRFLAWAVVGLLMVDPWLCRSTGFVLSVCASAGILAWAGRWALTLGRWVPRGLAEAISVPVAAQLATQPIVTAISGQVSLAGIAANLVAAPLVGPGTVLGFLTAALSVVVLPAAVVTGWLAGGFAQALCWVAQAGSALPGAVLPWPDGPVALGVLVACCVVTVVGLPLLWRRPWLVLLLALAVVVALLRPASVPDWPPPGWQVVSCDVGQGDATVISVAAGQAIVVDSGPAPHAVDRCLERLGITDVVWLVLTHLHADHAGGLAGVASGRRVHNLLHSGVTEPAGGWRLVETVLPHVPRTVARPGLVVAAGQVQLAVLAVKPYFAAGETGEDSSGQNDSSLVMRVTTGTLRVLLAGDVEEAGQANAVATVDDLSAEVLLVPHHGSGRQSPAFLAAVHQTVALVSVGADNDYGHPAARTIATVAGAGTRVYRTDEHGDIAVRRQDATLVVTTQRNG